MGPWKGKLGMGEKGKVIRRKRRIKRDRAT